METLSRDMRMVRSAETRFKTREDSGELRIEGYFAVFNSNYEIWDGYTESIAPGAFAASLGGDVRALVNHDTTLVLGRTTAGTLELREDDTGLWGSILINPNDQDAMNRLGYPRKILEIPTRFNECIVNGFTDSPAIVHYAGFRDAWNNPLAPRREYYAKYRDMTWEEALKGRDSDEAPKPEKKPARRRKKAEA